MVRNYMTRKPYSTEKIKLNFENYQLMAGWDLNKEKDHTAILLRKDGLYYLAIMNKKWSNVFDADLVPHDGPCYSKMEYKLLPSSFKMFPKVFLPNKERNRYGASNSIIKNYGAGTHKKISIRFCHIED